MSRNPIRSTTSLALSLGKTAAHVAAQFAPIPALAPAAELLCAMIQLCENVTQNRNAASQLRDRCHRLALVLYEKCGANENMTGAIQAVTECFVHIQTRMAVWAMQSKVQAFLQQAEIKKDIEQCHDKLSDCLTAFQLISHTEIHDWQAQFALNAQQDHRELMEFLAGIENSQTITNDALQVQTDALQSQTTDIRQLMAMMQELLRRNVGTGDRLHNGLASNLYELQLKSRELLPDFNLRSGEVVRLGQFPIGGTSTMDIYDGLYLQREKVAIKTVRAVKANEDSLRRFNRECKIWKDLWKIDQGNHVLPFYGFCLEDPNTPFPYMVSPWQPNGTALNYVKKHDTDINYMQLIKGVALGIQVLHGMNPPVVHGDIKASNIVINGLGNPLLADFGLSRIVEDIGMDTQSHGVSESYRWFAPELCTGKGTRSLRSDVYAYGMTVLELLTHQHPFSNIKHTTEVVVMSARGEQPERPMAPPRVLERGFDDSLWSLLCHCWVTEPSQRPTIQEVLEMFSQ
ncbi:kinase-like domain-containing protein [Mycena latifolia]|nr:kinase-like domain-containing protein [Mycena latifolia]